MTFTKKNQVLEFLNTKVKSYDEDPDKRWITTWNNYLNHSNSHPTYNERQQKIIELIDWTLEKYKSNKENTKQNEQVIINNIIEELDKNEI